MAVDDGRVQLPGSSGWPPRPTLTRRRPEPSRYYAYLLDADDDLADEFDIRMRIVARQATTVRVLVAEVGECDLSQAFAAVGAGAGLLLLDGLIAYETCVAQRIATELVGAGDLLQPPRGRPEELLEREGVWRVLGPTRLALLDASFSERVRPWPQIVHALLRRADRRIADVDAMRAITCHPRLEVRLVLLFWHLAGRWGRVEPNGIRLTLPLTHRLLGQLVGAERPSISHALARLSHAGLVTGAASDFHLHGTLAEHLEVLLEHGPGLTARGSARSRARQELV